MTDQDPSSTPKLRELWFGIGKLAEESGELGQLLGKAIPFPEGEHPDGKGSLRDRLPEEVSDLYAALDYFVEANGLPRDAINARRAEKVEKFRRWGLSGILVRAPSPDGTTP